MARHHRAHRHVPLEPRAHEAQVGRPVRRTEDIPAEAEGIRDQGDEVLPARTTVGVTALALGGAVEIDLIVRP